MYYLAGILLLLTGIFINYSVARRRFNRRGPAGLQHYCTYRGALLNTLAEKIAKLIGWALIIGGLGTLLLVYSQSTAV